MIVLQLTDSDYFHLNHFSACNIYMPREAHNMMQSFFHRVQIIAKPHQANPNSTPSDCLECQEIIFGVLLLATGLERKEREGRVAENTIYLI